MFITENNTVAEVVTSNIKTADIFKKHGIDFCCGGGISIKKACEKNNIPYETLEKELSELSSAVSKAYNYDGWKLDFLADHIENIHHSYVAESTPLVLQYAERVAKVHGHHYAEVIKINTLFKVVAQELAAHMKKEELILFPFIKQLVKADEAGVKVNQPHFGTVNNPIKMMEEEHESAGDILKEIKKLANNYTPPEGACNTFKALYAKLEEFEQDLHQHIHLENNILFPKAIILEQKNKH
ncbi:iron-sulfur cluster repair di-iron protein [Polaribacter sp. IC073]|uniref:iron-sulfur cluster repair di-iron protein n=1 Tax=Polaribacter sp. IC073 TaxID=2508540 RepID=UPI0011BDADDB|nr:iron-sulfur cluster repair di-iron protein [Polaribacter sp. IC073]TXD48460.1 iron-sulfur cluster repair di-iron protein [Polaribacter sp. IC073]